MRALCSVSDSDVISCSDVTSVIVHAKTPLHRRVHALHFRNSVLMQSHILSSDTKRCYLVHLDFIHSPVELAIILPPPQTLHNVERSASSFPCLIRIHWCGLTPVCHAPLSVRLVHRFPLMRLTRDHLLLVSNSEINQTSSGFLGNWGKLKLLLLCPASIVVRLCTSWSCCCQSIIKR